MEGMGIVEKEGGLPVFDTDNLKDFLPAVDIITWLMGKISANLPAVEGLKERGAANEGFSKYFMVEDKSKLKNSSGLHPRELLSSDIIKIALERTLTFVYEAALIKVLSFVIPELSSSSDRARQAQSSPCTSK